MPSFPAPGKSPPSPSRPTAGELPSGLRFARFGFTLAFTQPAIFTQLPGFTLRSALGRALRREVPAAYEALYRTATPARAVRFRQNSPPPRPYVFRIDDPLRSAADPGEVMEVEVVLLGTDEEVLGSGGYLEALLRAFVAVEADGLGARRGEGFGAFRTLTVAALAPNGRRLLLWDRAAATLAPFAVWTVGDALPARAPLPSRAARIRFTSPTTLMRDGAVAERPDFDLFAERLLERLGDLACLYGGAGDGADGITSPPLPALRTLARPDPCSAPRFQRDAGRTYDAGGTLGDLLVEGDLVPWHSILRAGELLQVGNQTTHGNGAFHVLPLVS